MRNSIHPRLRVILVVALLGAISIVLVGCGTNYTITTKSELSFKGYEDNGSTMVFHVTAGTTSTEHGVWNMNFALVSSRLTGSRPTSISGGEPTSTPDCTERLPPKHWRSWPAYDFRLPTSNTGRIVAGDEVALRLSGQGGFCNPGCEVIYCEEDTAEAWTNYVTIPAYVPPTAAPVVSLFAHATPVGVLGTLIDARLSTGTGTLRYEWSPAVCAGTTYPLGIGHDGEAAPAGTARYSGTAPTTCTVVVRDANGNSSSKTLDMPAIDGGLQNSGWLSFAGGNVVATVTGGLSPTRACLDLDNTGAFSSPVELVWDPTLGGFKASVQLTQIGAGLHRVSATLWTAGANDTCANTTATGAVQVISNLYAVDAAGALSEARRGVRSSSFVAPSSLRFASSKTISEGTFDTKSGTIKGATTSGSFTWATPTSAKGVKRPVGAAKLAKGTYVMRSVDMMQGPLVGNASTLLGTGTVLLRGIDGTLACGTLAGGFDSSTLTFAGGTRGARTLAGNVAGKRVTYVFPTPAGGAAKSGHVAGVRAKALGWITGDQPAERAKKPAKKPKLVKVKPVKATGTASLQTAAKPAGLPASCKALVQYLPQ